jgi:tetratricopeptide (TPR) repeat protein
MSTFVDVPAAVASIEQKLKKEDLTTTPPKKDNTCTETFPSAAMKIDSLAASKYRQGNYKEAAELLRRALSIREEFLGPDDIDLLNNVNNLSSALGRLKRYDEAEALFRRVLKGREDKLGMDHIDTLATVNHLGVIVKQQRKLTEAEPLLLRALTGLQALETHDSQLPANGLLYAEASYNYAVLCVQLGKRHKAAKYFGIAHQRLEVALGKENPHTMDSLHWQLKCMKFKPESAVKSGDERTTADDATPSSPKKTAAAEAAAPTEETPADAAAVAAADAAVGTEAQQPNNVLGVDNDEEHEMYVSKNTWKNATNCELCSGPFTITVRPHHCRICARCVCDHCSKGKTVSKEFGLTTPVRCCYLCEQQGF